MIYSDTSGTSSTHTYSTTCDGPYYPDGYGVPMGSYTYAPSSEDSVEKLLAIAAAEKDRLYWSFKVVLVWMWNYMPVFLLLVLRLMISLSGWLARVGKRIKSGN